MLSIPWHDIALALCIFLSAVLYSSVGHGGSSAYIAMMALFGVQPATMKPTALVLNLVVASLGVFRYLRAGLFRWRVVWPFLIGAVPLAFLGGSIVLPGHWYRPLVGAILWLSAVRMLWPRKLAAESETSDPPIVVAIIAGAAIGFLSGLTGTGGGFFLSPLLIFMAWCAPKPASGVAALFILANSAAGLAALLILTNSAALLGSLSPNLPLFAVAALAGGLIGTTLGIKLQTTMVIRALGLVLIVAGAKLIGVY